ncbi:hypothetical protein CsatA_025484 [Cannabis sativa]
MCSISAISNAVLRRRLQLRPYDIFPITNKTSASKATVTSYTRSQRLILSAPSSFSAHPHPPEIPTVVPDREQPSVPLEVPPLITTSPDVGPGGDFPSEVIEIPPPYEPDPEPEIDLPHPSFPPPPGPDIFPPRQPPGPEIDPPRWPPPPDVPPVRPPGPDIVPPPDLPPDIKPPTGSPTFVF